MAEFEGCGEPATLVICRGRVKRTFACAACAPKYEGTGRTLPYATDVEGVEKPAGVYTGPARVCGEEVVAC